MGKGTKHICASCGTKYYDLEKANHACPKCGTVGALKGNSKYKKSATRVKKRGATDKPEEKLKTLILFKVSENNPKTGLDIFGRSYDLRFPDAAAGWYVTSASDTENNVIKSRDTVLFLSTAPLDGLTQFLSSRNFSGIGQVGASDLVREHGEKVLTSIVKSKDTIAKELGVDKKKANALEAGWGVRLTSNIFNIFLNEIGLSPFQIREVGSKYGADIVKTLRRNPFELVKAVSRFDFTDVARVCGRLHLEVSEEQQIVAAAEFYLRERAEKRLRHTCLPKDNLIQRVSELLSKPEASIDQTISANEGVFVFGDRKNRVVVSTKASAARDDELVQSLKKISKNYSSFSKKDERKVSDFEVHNDIELSKEQIDAVNLAINNPICLITGGPGAGKTTMLQALVSSLKDHELKVRICAPTGKAAKRISENRYLAKFKPSTIHMYLAQAESAKFDTMIVDEASMIDIELMLDLVNSLPIGCSIVLVGDADQLPPVGAGQPFKDLLESQKIPTAFLTGNYRQDSFSDTVISARNIIKGKMPPINGDLSASDFNFFECPQDQQAEAVLRLYFELLPQKLNVSPIDLQILTPQRPGHVGLIKLNELIQKRITGDSKILFTKKSGNFDMAFRIGDKVIQKKNSYKLGIMNGDQGTILRESKGQTIVEFNGRNISLDNDERYDLELAYATTVHSSQGSEYPGVIMPITASHAHMLSRQLIYTGVTRGKRQVCLVGEAATLKSALAQFQKDFRWTNLVTELSALPWNA